MWCHNVKMSLMSLTKQATLPVGILYFLVYKFLFLWQENVSVVGLSGSEVSDSGLTSEDEDNRVRFMLMLLSC